MKTDNNDYYRVYRHTNYYGRVQFSIEHNGNECAVSHNKYVLYEGSYDACKIIYDAIQNDTLKLY
jgi:hypothetical protein